MLPTELNISKWLESDAYQKQKEIINREVNKHKVFIDYACFKKQPGESAMILQYKSNLPKSRGHKFKIFFKGSF